MEVESEDMPLKSHETPHSWHVYFPQEDYSPEDRRAQLMQCLIDFFRSNPGEHLLSQTKLDESIYSLAVDFQALKRDMDSVLEQSSLEDVYAAFEVAPKEALLCTGAAAYEVLFQSGKEAAHPGKINIRVHNHLESALPLKHLKAAFIGRLISVRGTVVRMSIVKPLVLQMDFTCGKCGSTISRRFPDGRYSPPTNCSLDGCRSKSFIPNRTKVKSIDFQKLRIQELLRADGHEEGRMPRTVECELTEDLVDACVPGDVVTICGIVKVINTDIDVGGGKAKNKNQCLFYLYLEAISVTNAKSQTIGQVGVANGSDCSRAAAPPNAQKFSAKDLEFIVRFAEEHGADLFRQILHSICPSIYGHELVKAGITLALFGGVQKHIMDENKVPVRGDIHVIVVGDPGLGKSQLLQAAAAVAPRGIYVCGNTTTAAGLTVAVVKDVMTGDYVFEAGAMVLADRGLCCIDEFDKMSVEHQALLEAMEQQCVSVAKAGLVASLSARTSVLAAANPVGGHYNRAKTVNENLKMSAALLSRFDLVFILLDKPDELMDQRLSEHIMALHAGSEVRSNAAKHSLYQLNAGLQQKTGKGASLVTRLKLDQAADTDFAPLPAPLLRKYISYARQFVFPRMSRVAAEVLQQFYLQLRNHSHSADGSPITARQLESLVRLVEARARVELREEISRQDALDVVEIMKESLYDKFVDEHGCVDFGRSGGMSQQKEVKRFLNALQRKSELQQKALFSISELYVLADDISLNVPDLESFIGNLNNVGHLLKKGPRTYQVMSSSYSGTQRGSGSRSKF
ncbi:hypothetical protein O6H91_03G063600 [Diphasiastrum complanatum]|uniref:Uncharacterized protein n=1 Tax=Diphasiastrum complanatum TaxID=34168 RepID=A0ACC2E739_DIPCM|nr:hypothetical protein O6H91_03G063600 [Diphasiastrum complanatum]